MYDDDICCNKKSGVVDKPRQRKSIGDTTCINCEDEESVYIIIIHKRHSNNWIAYSYRYWNNKVVAELSSFVSSNKVGRLHQSLIALHAMAEWRTSKPKNQWQNINHHHAFELLGANELRGSADRGTKRRRWCIIWLITLHKSSEAALVLVLELLVSLTAIQ